MKKVLSTLVCIFMFSFVFSANTMFPPTLTTPTNGAVNQMPNTFLNWAAVPGAFSYKIQVSLDSLFITSSNFTTNLTAYTLSHLLFNSKYFWRVKAIGVSDSSDWCIAGKFYIISTVTIIQPVNGATNRPVSCYFKWNAITGITDYEYQIDTSMSFSSPLFVTSNVGSAKIDAYSKQLTFEKHYYLRMRARHPLSISNWSNVADFYTLTDFLLRHPQNDTINALPVTAFKWDWTGSKQYTYTLATDSLFTTNVISYIVDTTKVIKTSSDTIVRAIPDTLLFGKTYYWKVQAQNLLDSSNETIVWKFSTIDKMTLLAPVSGATGITTIPTLTWKALTGIGTYYLEIDTSASFLTANHFVIKNDTSSYTFIAASPLLPNKPYYWRMKATTQNDTSSWSDVFNFTTTSPIGIEEIGNNSVSIFPNPSLNGKINIQIAANSSNDISISVLNLVGQEIFNQMYSIKNGNKLISLDLNSNPNGIYFIKLKQGDNIITRKIILSK